MPASFLHGVETFEANIGPVPIQVVPSAVVGLVGSAPLFAVPGATQLWDPYLFVQAAPQWTASTSQFLGNLLVDANGNTQKATTAGITGPSVPFWQRALGATTNDGSVVWTLIAIGNIAGQQVIDSNGNIEMATAITAVFWTASHSYNLGDMINDSNGNTQRATVAGTAGSGSHPTWATALGATTSDNSVTWTLVAIGRGAPTGSSAPIWPTTIGNTVSDGNVTGSTGGVTWTLIAKGPIPNLQQPVLIAGSNPSSLAPGQSGTFGPQIQGFTIPYALSQVFQQGAGQAIVVNVFDQTKHYSTIAAQTFTFPSAGVQVINIGHMGLSSVLVTNVGASITYAENVDFTVDHVNGVITAKGGGLIVANQTVQVTCNYADPSKLVDADLVGNVTGGTYTGMQCWKLAYGLMGFFPKLLIAPAFGTTGGVGQSVGSQDTTVAAGLGSAAAAVRAMYFVDCPPGTQVATLLSNRGTIGNSWNTSDKRAVLCGPQELFQDNGIVPGGITVDPISGKAIQTIANLIHPGPFSPWVAGATAAKDLAQGYWWSPSNTQILGPLGPDVSLYASFIDSASDTNTLNSQGIVTAFEAFGTGVRVWGNRSAGFPSYTTPDVFIPIRRTMDVIEYSVMLAMFQYLDQPITNGLIQSILATVNSFLRVLISRGALVGSQNSSQNACTFNPNENPPSQIANGQLVFDIDVMPPPPAERLTFNIFIDVNILSQLTGAAAQATG